MNSESDVINLLKQRNVIRTIIWNYPDWHIGAKVNNIIENNREYLRTDPNAT